MKYAFQANILKENKSIKCVAEMNTEIKLNQYIDLEEEIFGDCL